MPALFDQAISGTTVIGPKFMKITKGGRVSMQTVARGTPTGTWKFFGSNKEGADVNGDADAPDVTAAFKDGTGAAVTNPSGSPLNQMTQAGPVYFAYIGGQFTPASGAGSVALLPNEVVSS
jgi:hypothetical protein